MLISLILTILLIIYLIIASIHDIKTREVPDWLSFSLIPLAIILRIIESFLTKTHTPITQTLITFAIFTIISLTLYYTRQWGGGDAKMFMAIGATLPTYPRILAQYLSPNLNIPFPAILIINTLIAGAIYGIFYFMSIAAKNHIQIKTSKKVKTITFFIVAFVCILILISPPQTKIPLLFLAVLLAIFPYATKLSKTIQNKYLIKKIPLSKITEGDWIAKSIYKNKKLLVNEKVPGITKEQIQLLKDNKIKTIIVKYGIPFIPSFLIGVLISLLIGNLFIF